MDSIRTTIVLFAGLVLGIIIKLLDLFTSNLGNIFSQMSVWIFLCTLIAIYSSTAKRAALNVFCFCLGMLLTYYATAEVMNGVYSNIFVLGWLLFTLFVPIMGYIVWYAQGTGIAANLLSVGIIAVMLIMAIILFDKIRVSDILFAVLLSVLLFKKRR